MDVEDGPQRFGPFVLLYPLGMGGMGTAHLAMSAAPEELERPNGALFAVKRLHASLAHEPTVLERFVHEAEVASHVQHPHVAELVGMGSVGDEPFLAMEFVFGVQLTTLIDRIEAGATPRAPAGPAVRLAAQLAGGVRAIHEARHRETGAPLGLLHRDLGARNVLVGYDGRGRVIDLGLGKSVLADWHTSVEVLAGSPDYMPPEQAMGVAVDVRADVYALAVTIWEILVGRRRIREEVVSKRIERCLGARPEPVRNACPEISPRMEALLMEAMRPEPELRLPAVALLEEGLLEEAQRLRAVDDEEVARWLDGACATLRARDFRRVEAARQAGLAMLESQRFGEADTRMYVGDLAAYARRATSQVEPPPPPTAPIPVQALLPQPEILHPPTPERSWLGEVGRLNSNLESLPQLTRGILAAGFLAVAALTAVITVRLSSGPGPEVRVLALPYPDEGAPHLPPPLTTTTELPVSSAEPRPGPVRSPPVSGRVPRAPSTRVDEARRQQLVLRIRELRKRSFKIGFQREVTRLSALVTQARSKRALDTIEQRLKKLEEAR